MKFKTWLQQEELQQPDFTPKMPSQFNPKPTTSANVAQDAVAKTISADPGFAQKMATLPGEPKTAQNRTLVDMTRGVLKTAGTAAKQTTPPDVHKTIQATAVGVQQ